jgi:ABC-type multidrug transport system fused ATPase/permease subunit
MTTSNNPIDHEALRTEIQAAIAAGRELDPSMDKHLADSVVERYLSSQPQNTQVDVPQYRYISIDGIVLRFVSVLLSAGIIIALLSAQIWWMLWLIIPILGILIAIFREGSRNKGKWQVRNNPSVRQQYRKARLEYKLEKLETKRAILKGIQSFSQGFNGDKRD